MAHLEVSIQIVTTRTSSECECAIRPFIPQYVGGLGALMRLPRDARSKTSQQDVRTIDESSRGKFSSVEKTCLVP